MLANVPEGLKLAQAEKQAGRLTHTHAHTIISIDVWHTDANIHTHKTIEFITMKT